MLKEDMEMVRMLAREEISLSKSAIVKGVVAKEVRAAMKEMQEVMAGVEEHVKSLEDKVKSLEAEPSKAKVKSKSD